MVWFTASALAQTETVDSAEIQRMIDELQPRVEQVLGRPPIGPLQAGILTRDEIRAAIEAPAPAVGAPIPSAEDRLAADHVRDSVAEDLRLAVYVGQTRGVFVVQESLDTVAEQIAAEKLRPVLRCLLVHELVHAVQHAYGTIPTDADADGLDGWNALREGHATTVELSLCNAWEGPDIAIRVAGLHGIDAPGSLSPRSTAARYAWGRTLVETLNAEDPELVWAALAGAPPTWTDLVRDIRPLVGAGWQDARPVTTALRESDPEVRSTGLQPLGALLGVPGGLGLPLVSSGWVVETPTRVVAAFRTVEPGLPAVIVERRDSMTRGSGAFLLTAGALEGDLELDRGTVNRLDERGGVHRTLRLDVSSSEGGGYHERWVATEHSLVLMVTRGQRSFKGDDAALDTLFDHLPEGPLPPVTTADLTALGPWLDDVRAHQDTLEPVPGPQWRLLDAALAWQGGDPAPCGPAFGDVLVPGALRYPQAQAAQAYVCAAAAQETDTADRAAALLDALPAIPAAIHARNLVRSGRSDEALTILDRTSPSNASERRTLAHTRMNALGASRRWEELVALASGPEGSTSMLLQVALTLGRVSDGEDGQHVEWTYVSEEGR